MSVPPELMQRMMQGGGQGGPQATPRAPAQAPAAAPISSPQKKEGLKAAAHTNIHIAVNMLEEALPAFGSESAEGQKIIGALKTLGGLVAKRDESDLVPAEVLQMVRQLPQMGGGTDVQRQILQQMQQGQQKPQQAAA
jgi:hypothetical protein